MASSALYCPESHIHAHPVHLIGVDDRELPDAARQALERSGLVLGGARQLAACSELVGNASTVRLGPLAGALQQAEAAMAAGTEVAVLASGDPGFFGVLRALRERGIRPRVWPGVSSVARLFAAIGRPWDDVTVLSAHGRELRPALNSCRAEPACAVLTAPGAGPAELGAGLTGWPRTLVVGELLGAGEQRISTVSPQQAAVRTWSEPNVVAVLADPDATPPLARRAGSTPRPGWALPEAAFEHRDGMITKAEVRALVLARLAPAPGRLVWDLGAGSGAVAVECARMGAAAVAVESDAAQCRRIAANARSHGVTVLLHHDDAAALLEELPSPDAVFLGGGDDELVRRCAQRAARLGVESVVLALAAVDRLAVTRDVLSENGFSVEGVQLSASRMAPLPGGRSRMVAANPVWVLTGTRTATTEPNDNGPIPA